MIAVAAGKEDPESARAYAKSDSSSDSEEEEEEIAAVEMILETYFMHLDNTYNKLQTLCKSFWVMMQSIKLCPFAREKQMKVSYTITALLSQNLKRPFLSNI